MSAMLVALDGSARSGAVLTAALDVAAPLGARVRLFRAVVIPPEFAAAAGDAHSAVTEYMLFDARSELAALADGAPRLAGVPWDVEAVVATSAWRAILEATTRVSASLIVLGSCGHAPLDRVLGTTAVRVVNRAPCNVLVVRTATDALQAG